MISPYHENVNSSSRFGPKANHVLSRGISGVPDPKQKSLSQEITPDISLNSNNFRSDEFRSEHTKKHFLFSGCSNTFGLGLRQEEMWSSRFLSMLSNAGEESSGYFNLSIPGGSVFDSVTNVIKYCDQYSKPDVIFLQVSNIGRYYSVNSRGEIVTANMTTFMKHKEVDSLNDVIRIYAYQYLLFLDVFCKSHGIKLFILSWPPVGYFGTEPELDNYYVPNMKEMSLFVRNYIEDHPEDPYALDARDNTHPGNGQQEYWAQVAFNLYNESVKEK